MSEFGRDGDGPVGAVMVVKEGLGRPAGDDTSALVLEEGRGVALEDCGGVGESFEDEAGEEAAEGAADLWEGGGFEWALDERGRGCGRVRRDDGEGCDGGI